MQLKRNLQPNNTVMLHLSPKSEFAYGMAEELFLTYFSRLSYYSYQFVQDKEIANDIVQDSFEKLWQLDGLKQKEQTQLVGFLYSSVRNASLNVLKKNKVKERFSNFLLNQTHLEPTKEDLIIEAELMAKLHFAISTLPEKCRNIFYLSYFDGLSNQKIADLLVLSIQTVKNHKQNGLKVLRSKLLLESFLSLLFFFL